MQSRYALGLVVAGMTWIAACMGSGALVERPNAAIPGSKFKVIATIAAGGGRSTDIRMSVTVRQQLNNAGLKGVARAGHWDTQGEATNEICEDGEVDGILYVYYNRLELTDCATKRAAFEIEDNGGRGLDEMVRHLMRYILGEQAPEPKH